MSANTTTKVALRTGAAKDDVFDHLTEDVLCGDLNVLANDPGSARVVSIGAPTGSGSQMTPITEGMSRLGAALTINPDGTIHYDGSSLHHMLQSLGAGQSMTDTFTYVVRMANGALSTATVTVLLQGVNDPPTLASIEPVSVHDTDIDDTPAAIEGTLSGSDIDQGDEVSYGLKDGVPTGNANEVAVTNDFGTLTLNTQTGAYRFEVNPAAFNGLAAGVTERVSFEVRAVDSQGAESLPQSILIDLIGANDTPTFGGDDSGVVSEDGTLSAGGTLTVSDRDSGQTGFQAVLNGLNGTYGDFTFDESTGGWTYALRNSESNVQALNTGDTRTDTLTVQSLDGATKAITVTIQGANEPAGNPSVIVDVTNGLAIQNGPQRIFNFDSNDQLELTGQLQMTGLDLIDYLPGDNNPDDSTQIFVANGNGAGSVILVGYTSFDATAQLIP